METSRTSTWNRAQQEMSAAYFPHLLEPQENDSLARPVLAVLTAGPVSIVRLGWGAVVTVTTTHPGAYAVNLPLVGRIGARVRGRSVDADGKRALVFDPDTPVSITTESPRCEVVGVKIDSEFFVAEIRRVFGGSEDPLPSVVNLHTQQGGAWQRFARSLVIRDAGGELWSNPLVSRQVAGALVTGFLLATMPQLHDDGVPVRPRTITRVLEAVDADPSLPWTSSEMAELGGIGVRRLQQSFLECMGTSPRGYLLDVRLSRIYADLVAADPRRTTVTEVALNWGIAHMGRFAGSYQRKYGETPSATLHRL